MMMVERYLNVAKSTLIKKWGVFLVTILTFDTFHYDPFGPKYLSIKVQVVREY